MDRKIESENLCTLKQQRRSQLVVVLGAVNEPKQKIFEKRVCSFWETWMSPNSGDKDKEQTET
ncbi:hypothetical protein K6Q96_23205 [Grimontia kaedaensis]|uniref:Uncharacterized protein n=1 Tax=Grimontia kaedaensis TaxID=2872157 RepID=A0ABY4X093_9GAMM|nr:hypothetical protein [Grimontia kaedaensis]USH04630.1 hypothetical protein K6Q96_23205 [Grimontia kaedaensis]